MKEQIKFFVKEGLTVNDMALRLHIDYNHLVEQYILFSKEDRKAFPIDNLLTKELLAKLLEDNNFKQIINKYCIAPSVLKRLCVQYDIGNRTMLKNRLPYAKMHSLFVIQHLSDSEIAKRYSCSIESIKKLRKAYGIEAGMRIHECCDLSFEDFYRLFVEYGFTINQIAQMLGISYYMVLEIRSKYEKYDCERADEIKNRKKFYGYQSLIDLLLQKENAAVLLTKLKRKTLAEVAEEYKLIPEPVAFNIETFTPQWLEYVLKRMSREEIIDTYHIGRSLLEDMINKNGFENLTPKNSLDGELIKTLYCDNYWTDDEIAFLLSTSTNHISSFRKIHNIKRSKRDQLSRRLSLDEFCELYLIESATVAQIAEIYRVSDKAVTALKTLYGKQDPRLKNNKARGVSEIKLKILKKKARFAGFIMNKVNLCSRAEAG